MPLMDEFVSEYYRQNPLRTGRPIHYPDWLPGLLRVMETRLAGKIDKLPPYSAEGREAQYTARSKQEMDIE
jgi:hypothetical protein